MRWLILLLVLDQMVKQWLMVGGRVIELNYGVAWGWGAGFDWLIVVLGLLWWVYKKFGWNWPTGMILAGGLSNLLDRVRWGGVVDYLNFFNLFSCNLADGLVVAGAVGLIYSLAYGSKSNIRG